mmetsp:Transcript_14051/g.20771  ORF Transcript_14051/g.20771 Transcript_14051/m.20771 type:complete len:223 (+) Transcript_14051:367-1035(+)
MTARAPPATANRSTSSKSHSTPAAALPTALPRQMLTNSRQPFPLNYQHATTASCAGNGLLINRSPTSSFTSRRPKSKSLATPDRPAQLLLLLSLALSTFQLLRAHTARSTQARALKTASLSARTWLHMQHARREHLAASAAALVAVALATTATTEATLAAAAAATLAPPRPNPQRMRLRTAPTTFGTSAAERPLAVPLAARLEHIATCRTSGTLNASLERHR